MTLPTRWLVMPARIDVILHPREWRICIYPFGFGLNITGHYSFEGTGMVCRDFIRIGRPPRSPRRWYIMGVDPRSFLG